MKAYNNERASFLSPSSLRVWENHWVWVCRSGICSIIEEHRHSKIAQWLSSFVFCCCDKTSWPKQRGEKRVYLASSSQLQSIMNWSQCRNSGRNPEAGTGAETWALFTCLVLIGLFSLLSHTTRDHLRPSGIACYRLGPPTSITDGTYMPVWWRHSLCWGFFFLNDSSVCQADKKN